MLGALQKVPNGKRQVVPANGLAATGFTWLRRGICLYLVYRLGTGEERDALEGFVKIKTCYKPCIKL